MKNNTDNLGKFTTVISIIGSVAFVAHIISWSYVKGYFGEVGVSWIAPELTLNERLTFSDSYLGLFVAFFAVSLGIATAFIGEKELRIYMVKIVGYTAFLSIGLMTVSVSLVEIFHFFWAWSILLSQIIFAVCVAFALVWSFAPLINKEIIEVTIRVSIILSLFVLFGLFFVPTVYGALRGKYECLINGVNLPRVIAPSLEREEWRLLYSKGTTFYIARFSNKDGVVEVLVMDAKQAIVINGSISEITSPKIHVQSDSSLKSIDSATINGVTAKIKVEPLKMPSLEDSVVSDSIPQSVK